MSELISESTTAILDAVAKGTVTKAAAKAELKRRLAGRRAAGKAGGTRLRQALAELDRWSSGELLNALTDRIAELEQSETLLKRELEALQNGGGDRADVHKAVLGLDEEKRSVKVAFRRVAGIVHPDKHGGDPEAVRLMRLANAAAEALGVRWSS